MHVIDRDDGPLLVDVYRDTIFASQKATARDDVERLAESQGDFMLIQKVPQGWRVAVAHQSGYLLAECLLARFRVQNLFYVEEVATDDLCIVIVVVDGVVVEDGIVHRNDVRQTAATQFIEKRFHVRVSGTVPMREPNSGSSRSGEFFIPDASSVESWEVLPSEYRLQVPIARQALLIEWKTARNRALGFNFGAIGMVAVLVVVGVVAYQTLIPEKTNDQGPPPDPLAAAVSRWQSGPPIAVVLVDVASITERVLQMPGWYPYRVQREGNGYAVIVQPSDRLSKAELVATSFPGRVQAEPNSRNYRVVIDTDTTSRPRPQFEAALTGMGKESDAAIVDVLTRSGLSLSVIHGGAEMGHGYRGHQFKVLADMVTPLMLRAAAARLHDRFETASVQAMEYSPLDGKLSMDIIYYTR